MSPATAASGTTSVMTGCDDARKFVTLSTLPTVVTTVIGPSVAPLGTVAEICFSAVTLKVAIAPLKRTAVALVKLAPLMTTGVPGAPSGGENASRRGGTVKFTVLFPTPDGLVTYSRPDVAVTGTMARIWLPLRAVKSASASLKRSWVVVENPLPLTVTVVPGGPLAGENEVMTGTCATATPTHARQVSQTPHHRRRSASTEVRGSKIRIVFGRLAVEFSP